MFNRIVFAALTAVILSGCATGRIGVTPNGHVYGHADVGQPGRSAPRRPPMVTPQPIIINNGTPLARFVPNYHTNEPRVECRIIPRNGVIVRQCRRVVGR
jgi:prolipoprotein diacylglyceryltransferase